MMCMHISGFKVSYIIIKFYNLSPLHSTNQNINIVEGGLPQEDNVSLNDQLNDVNILSYPLNRISPTLYHFNYKF